MGKEYQVSINLDDVGGYLFAHVKKELGAVSGFALMPEEWCGAMFAYTPPWEGHEAELWTITYQNKWYVLYEGNLATTVWLEDIVAHATWAFNDGDEEYNFPS